VDASHDNYRGYLITTRSIEAAAFFDNALAFSGVFRIESAVWDEESWQQFPRGKFGTRTAALAGALTAAKRSIDLRFRVDSHGCSDQFALGRSDDSMA
jgi:hypothetical protein